MSSEAQHGIPLKTLPGIEHPRQIVGAYNSLLKPISWGYRNGLTEIGEEHLRILKRIYDSPDAYDPGQTLSVTERAIDDITNDTASEARDAIAQASETAYGYLDSSTKPVFDFFENKLRDDDCYNAGQTERQIAQCKDLSGVELVRVALDTCILIRAHKDADEYGIASRTVAEDKQLASGALASTAIGISLEAKHWQYTKGSAQQYGIATNETFLALKALRDNKRDTILGGFDAVVWRSLGPDHKKNEALLAFTSSELAQQALTRALIARNGARLLGS